MSGGSAIPQFQLSLSLQRTRVAALLKGWEVEVSSIHTHTLENTVDRDMFAGKIFHL